MRSVRFQRSMIWFLVLSLGHVPVPWLHHHVGLNGARLSRHLATFHASLRDDSRADWHLHFFCLGIPHQVPQDGISADTSLALKYALQSNRFPPPEDEANWVSFRRQKTQWRSPAPGSLFPEATDVGVSSRGHAAYGHAHKIQYGIPLFDLHRAMLI